MFVGQEPGHVEAKTGVPFTGPSGMELDRDLEAIGRDRQGVSINNAVLCMPPEGKMVRVIAKLQRENRARREDGEPPLPYPVDCCRPRLMAEIGQHKTIVAMGAEAAKSFIRGAKGILDIRGSFYEIPAGDVLPGGHILDHTIKVLPTIHPAFVLRSKRYRMPFVSDLARAFRWNENQLLWKEPRILRNPSIQEFRDAIKRAYEYFGLTVWDTETTGIEPLAAHLETMQVGDDENVCVWRRLDHKTKQPMFEWKDEAPYWEAIFEWLEDAQIPKLGQNSGYYDRLLMESEFDRRFGHQWLVIRNHYDTIMMHHMIYPEWPHSLAFMASYHTDTPEWKSEREAAQSNAEHDIYGGKDVCITGRVGAELIPQVYSEELLTLSHRFQAICAELHRNGQWIDPIERDRQDRMLAVKQAQWTAKFHTCVWKSGSRGNAILVMLNVEPDGTPWTWEVAPAVMDGDVVKRPAVRVSVDGHRIANGLRSPMHDLYQRQLAWEAAGKKSKKKQAMNPFSVYDKRRLLFDEWDLPIPSDEDIQPKDLFTESGDRSTNDTVLRFYVGDHALAAVQRDTIHALRLLSRFAKLRSTFVRPLHYLEPEEGEEFDHMAVHEDGRCHPDYKAHGTAVGRPSASNPNCFTGDTEILTEHGWIRFDELADGVRVMQYTPTEDGRGWAGITDCEVIRKPFAGSLVHLTNEHADLLCTPDHRLFVTHRKTREQGWVDAGWVDNGGTRAERFLLTHAAGAWDVINTSGLNPDEIRLLVAIQADGYVVPRVKGGWAVELSFKKARKIERARMLLTSQGWAFRESVDEAKGVTNFYVPHQDGSARVLRLLMSSGEKRFGDYILAFGSDIQVFADELVHWDGSIYDHSKTRHPDRKGGNYTSAFRENVDWAQVAMTLAGYRCVARTYEARPGYIHHRVDFTSRHFSGLANIERKDVPYEGTVYCVSVPSTWIIVRRNGKAVVVGNCLNVPAKQRAMFASQRQLVEMPQGTQAQLGDIVTQVPILNRSERRAVIKRWKSMGRAMVGADSAALHLRLIASRWQIPSLLEAFLHPRMHRGTKMEAHESFAYILFGEAFLNTPHGTWPTENADGKWKGAAKDMRDAAKTLRYAGAYGAKTPTIFREYTSVEDKETGRLIYRDVKYEYVEALHNRWMTQEPEWKRGWDMEVRLWKRQGFAEEPIFGRRRPCADEKETDVINACILMCVPGFSRVLTRQGYIPIAELAGSRTEVWTGKKWAWAECTPTGEGVAHRVETDRAPPFIAADRHKLLAVGESAYEWRRVDDLARGGRVAIDRARALEFGDKADAEDAYWMGFWIADGNSHLKNGEAEVSICISDGKKGGRGGPAEVDACVAWAARKGFEVRVSKAPGSTRVAFYVGASLWLRSWGADPAWRSSTKRIPERVWRSDLESRKAFFRGVLQGGSFNDKSALIGMCQAELINELWLLARTIGLDGWLSGPFDNGESKATGEMRQVWRLNLSLHQLWNELGWGEDGHHLHTAGSGDVPWWECQRVRDQLVPTCPSDRTIKTRLKGVGKTTPYILARMGVDDVYDHVRITGGTPRRVMLPMYTMIVDDPEHRYVSDGFVSKNCEGAVMLPAICEIGEAFPAGYAGPGTGMVNTNYDSVTGEYPIEDLPRVIPVYNQSMNRTLPGFDVPFAGEVGVAFWEEDRKLVEHVAPEVCDQLGIARKDVEKTVDKWCKKGSRASWDRV